MYTKFGVDNSFIFSHLERGHTHTHTVGYTVLRICVTYVSQGKNALGAKAVSGGSVQHATVRYSASRYVRGAGLELEFHDADTDTDILATILARMSARMSVSVSASWNASLIQHVALSCGTVSRRSAQRPV